MPPLENDDVQDIDHGLENEDGDTGSSQDRPVSQRERDIEAISAGPAEEHGGGGIRSLPRSLQLSEPEPNSDDQLAALGTMTGLWRIWFITKCHGQGQGGWRGIRDLPLAGSRSRIRRIRRQPSG